MKTFDALTVVARGQKGNYWPQLARSSKQVKKTRNSIELPISVCEKYVVITKMPLGQTETLIVVNYQNAPSHHFCQNF